MRRTSGLMKRICVCAVVFCAYTQFKSPVHTEFMHPAPRLDYFMLQVRERDRNTGRQINRVRDQNKETVFSFRVIYFTLQSFGFYFSPLSYKHACVRVRLRPEFLRRMPPRAVQHKQIKQGSSDKLCIGDCSHLKYLFSISLLLF